VWTDEAGRYGDPKGFIVSGIESGNVTVLTRIHIWKIEAFKNASKQTVSKNIEVGPTQRTKQTVSIDKNTSFLQ